jgi:O-antigen biosynthesis protein WbqP
MNLVGPRPALYNQDDLKELRTKFGIEKLSPGVTGWAQINGRDELPIPAKVQFDKEYLERKSIWFDLKIIFLTVYKVLARKNIQH